MSAPLPLRHFLLALAVVVVWGSNFVVIKVALDDVPPLLFATLRFMLALLPAVVFLRRPPVPWSNLALYGLFIGVGQFGLIYIAMDGHISPGLTSVVVQFQAFFTIALAMKLSGERLRGYQWCALLLAALGIGVVVMHTDGTTNLLGLVLVLVAAFSWACGNITSTKAGQINMLAYVVWSSAFAIPPLAALAIVFEGWDAISSSLHHATAATWAAVAWQAWANTLFGFGVWAWLLMRYPTATIAPIALLVPLFGMAASAWWLSESMPAWKLAAAALVITGLAVNLLWPRWRGENAKRDLQS